MLDRLLAKRDDDAVKALFNGLIDTYNRQLKQALLKKHDAVKNEGVSSEQLVLLFKQLEEIIGGDTKRR